MDIQKRSSPEAFADAGPGQGNTAHHHLTKAARAPHKWVRILRVLYSGRSLNRFEAERLSDHCLHSTISSIQGMGVPIARVFEKVPGYRGIMTPVCRYRLAPESRQAAAKLLGEWQPSAADDNAPQTLYASHNSTDATERH